MIWNKGTLSKHKSRQKSCHGPDLHLPKRYKSDVSNEVLYALVGQEVAKISEVKVRGRKKSARSARPQAHQSRIWLSWQFLIDLQLCTLIFFQPLDLQESTVPHLKDLIHICLESDVLTLIELYRWIVSCMYSPTSLTKPRIKWPCILHKSLNRPCP